MNATINAQTVNVTETTNNKKQFKMKSIIKAPVKFVKSATVGTLGAAHFVFDTAAKGCESLECFIEGDKTPEAKAKRKLSRRELTQMKQQFISYQLNRSSEAVSKQVDKAKPVITVSKQNIQGKLETAKTAVVRVTDKAKQAVHNEIHKFDKNAPVITVPRVSTMPLPVPSAEPKADEVQPEVKPTVKTVRKTTKVAKPKAEPKTTAKLKPVKADEAFDMAGVTIDEFQQLD